MLDHDRENGVGWVQIVAERRIAEAIEEGKFDNLPGKGKPIVFEDDPLTPAHLRITNHVLKNAEVPPTWISMEREIEAAKAQADAFWDRWLQIAESSEKLGGEDVASARSEYVKLLRRVNDLILRYNMATPFVHRAPIPVRIKQRLSQWDKHFSLSANSLDPANPRPVQ